ncbi:putative DNA-directed polymerase kappa [Metarhizium anisopliae]
MAASNSPQLCADAAAYPVESDGASKTLKYHLLGPSLTKAGQEKVDQSKVSEIIYNASRGSKFFNREEVRDQVLTKKIEQILARKRQLEQADLTQELRNADRVIHEFELSRDLTQHIVHIDCDAFYAAVEQLERPELKDVPFAVGGGVLTTCNYVARQFGCRSGMAGFVAKKLCPSLILIKPSFPKYTAKAQEIREILADYDPRFESASIDEAYLNITEYCHDKDATPAEVIEQMRREIYQKTDITVSAGIAANSKLAKICSNMNKPNGQYVLPSDRTSIMAFMRDLPTRKVNGIGRVLERELLELGVRTCGDIYDQRKYLNMLFGDKTFEFLIGCYLGLGRTKIQPAEEYERKSIGTESTFRELSDSVKLREKLRWTAEELEKDMERAHCKGRTLCLKIKLHTFEVFTRQVVMPRAICSADELYNFSLPILTKLEQEIPAMKLRLMGLRCTHLVSTKKPDTMAFFGLRRKEMTRTGDQCQPNQNLESQITYDKTEVLESLPAEDDIPSVASGQLYNNQSFESSKLGRHGKEVVPNPNKHGLDRREEWWDCPICFRPQEANEKTFNNHIDLCLSRKTIRDAVQCQIPMKAVAVQPELKRLSLNKKKEKVLPGDPKQKRLSFG